MLSLTEMLSFCEREPLHLSGAIQAHGGLLVVDAQQNITHVSANIAEYLGQPPDALLGKPLASDLCKLLAWLPATPGTQHRGRLLENTLGQFDLVLTRGEDGLCTLECLPHQPYQRPAGITGDAAMPADEQALRKRREALLYHIRDVTRFQRVLYYEFREDGDGEVVAEITTPDIQGSYLDLRFPGNDVPQIARALYKINPWRLIPDIEAEPVPILGIASTPPDLSRSDLRSVSLMHCAYLANLNVRSALSFPVVIGGELVALISAHGTRPNVPPLEALIHMAELVRDFSLALSAYRLQERFAVTNELSWLLHPLAQMIREAAHLAAAWARISPLLIEKMDVDGVAYFCGDVIHTQGQTPELETLKAINAWLNTQPAADQQLRWVESLRQHLPLPAGTISAGMTVIPFVRDGIKQRLYLLRNEHVYEVAWGGNPNKPMENEAGSLRISPRRSFEKWVETRSGYCHPWSKQSRMLANNLRVLLYGGQI